METGIHELTAGFALDALDADERRAYEEHLPRCQACQEELASFWEVTGQLALAATGPAPRPELRDRILQQARAEQPNVVPLTRRRPLNGVLAATTAVAAAVAIGLGIWAISLSDDLDRSRAATAEQRELAKVLSDSTARNVALSGDARGRVVVTDAGAAVLVVSSLDDPPPGRDYQLWVIDDAATLPAGTFDRASPDTAVALTRPVSDGAVVAVTVERDGGVDAPTSTPVVTSHPV